VVPGEADVTKVPQPEAAIGDYAKAHDFSGTILVQAKGSVVYHGSFGLADRTFDVPAANETRYRIASITKAFTAVLVLQLVEQGRPGQAFDYNNGDYMILGKIIERVAGATFDQVLRERILQPLGMSGSGMLFQREIVAGLASTYYQPETPKVIINDLPVYWDAAGAMYSTTSDLFRFSTALFGAKLLKAESLPLMLKRGLDNYGYGIWVPNLEIGGRHFRAAQRPGSVTGANCVLLRVLDEGLTIIILGNTNRTSIDAFSFFIAGEFLKSR